MKSKVLISEKILNFHEQTRAEFVAIFACKDQEAVLSAESLLATKSKLSVPDHRIISSAIL